MTGLVGFRNYSIPARYKAGADSTTCPRGAHRNAPSLCHPGECSPQVMGSSKKLLCSWTAPKTSHCNMASFYQM